MSSPAGPLQPPDADVGQQQQPQAQGPGPGGGFISPQPAQPNPNEMVLTWVRDIASTTRRIGMKFPSALQEVREINNALARLQQKIAQAAPAPEPMSPPV